MKKYDNPNFTGSLHFLDFCSDVDAVFEPFFSKHGIVKGANSCYGNQYAELQITASDHRHIDLTFRKVGQKDWVNLYLYLEIKLGVNDISNWRIHSARYSYSNLEEYARAFVQFYAELAAQHLNEPFENDFSWEEHYARLKGDWDLRHELMKRFPEERVLYKMFLDKTVRDQWRALAKEKLETGI